MKNEHYTLLKNGEGDILLIPTGCSYKVVRLESCEDDSMIWDGETLESTEGVYPSDYFEDSDKHLVISAEYANRYQISGEHFTIPDPESWEGEEIELVDVSDLYMSNIFGNAYDYPHGLNSEQIIFDSDEECDGWRTEEDVEVVDWYLEHQQDYPRQEYTRILVLADGRKIRETTPFDQDRFMETYEFVD